MSCFRTARLCRSVLEGGGFRAQAIKEVGFEYMARTKRLRSSNVKLKGYTLHGLTKEISVALAAPNERCMDFPMDISERAGWRYSI